MGIIEQLFEMQEVQYKNFSSSLMPTVAPDSVIGVRTPLLRKFAKKLSDVDKKDFISHLPHSYYEENNLHAFILCGISDFDICVKGVDAFLPYVDNWATCDSMRPKCFEKNTVQLTPYVDKWLSSSHTYTVRYGIGMLLSYFLDTGFNKGCLEKVAAIQSDEYYVNMMSAWFFATALAKQWEETIPYITENRLPTRVHNKAIQKAVESYRIAPEQKEYLKTFRRKN